MPDNHWSWIFEDAATITGLIANGTFKASIDAIFPLNQAKNALEKSETRHGRGRILLHVSSS